MSNNLQPQPMVYQSNATMISVVVVYAPSGGFTDIVSIREWLEGVYEFVL